MREVKKYWNNGQTLEHYWVNDNGKIEGEYKSWHSNGQIWEHCFYKNGINGLEMGYYVHLDNMIKMKVLMAYINYGMILDNCVKSFFIKMEVIKENIKRMMKQDK